MSLQGATSNGEDSQAEAHKKKSRYVPAIDGLRAFAVLAVIFYHMGLDWAPGGLMGVTVFFVISGYLINGMLVTEHARTGRISLKGFWLRRVRRIIPAVLLAIAGTVLLCAVISPALLEKARPDIVPSLLFYNNWWQVFRDLSYFEAAGAPSPLMHYWSLAIEEQFYIVWPLLLVLMFRLKVGKKPMAAIVLALAAASAIEMALLFDPHGDPSRVYYGTDTRAVSLLLGAFLAIVWPSSAFGSKHAAGRKRIRMRQIGDGHVFIRDFKSERGPMERLGRTGKDALDVAGALSLAGLLFIMVFTNGFDAFPYQGGIVLTSLLTAVLIAAAVVPGSRMARLLRLSPLVWIGKRSYSMYLWHFPIILLTSKITLPISVPWWVHIAQLVVIIAVSDLSYRFVENPIRKGALRAWAQDRATGATVPFSRMARRWMTAGALVAIALGAMAGLAFVPAPVDPRDTGTAVRAATIQVRPRVQSTLAAEKRRQDEKREAARKKAAQIAYDKLFMEQHENEKGEQIYEPLLIGDSIPEPTADEFYSAFPNGCLDAVIGRRIWESPYGDYLKAGQVGTYVVFCLGTNDPITDDQIDELLSEVSDDKKVILVNTRSTYFDWAEVTNKALARAPERHANVVAVIDWYAASEGHGEYFIDDATHLRPEGMKAYISLIEDAIKRSMDAE